MSAATGVSASSWELKPIVGEGREARMEYMRGKLPSDVVDDIINGKLKCRMLYDSATPLGAVVYSDRPDTFRQPFGRSLKIVYLDTFVSGSSVAAINRQLLDEVYSVARKGAVDSVHIFSNNISRVARETFSREGFTGTLTAAQAPAEFKIFTYTLPTRQPDETDYAPKRTRGENGEAHAAAYDRAPVVIARGSNSWPPLKGITLKKVYIHQIRRGDKTVEGRIFSGQFKNIKVGDHLRFFYMADAHDDVVCEVTAVKTYRTFDHMLTEVGYKRCVNDVYSHDQAVKAYAAIPGYTEKEARFGVVAFHLKVIQRPRE
jgi:ASC-1-like (ASCH) protein